MKVFGLTKSAIADEFTRGRLTVAVYGLGKMGLPLAAVFGERNARVIGVDSNHAVVEEINRGRCPVVGEPGLPEMLQANVRKGRLSATTDGVAASRESDVKIILVPCLLKEDQSPDLSQVAAAASDISQGLAKGDFVILETTVPPRTTRDLLLPILKQSGLKEGEFGLAFCPERTSSGRALQDITGAYVKVVGGVDQKSTETAEAIYSVINKSGVRKVSDSTTAEAVKVFEGVYRDVNIALSNEMALVCQEIGADPEEVFRVASEPVNEATKAPYTSFLQPGAGVGGHCIPVYPYFVIKTAKTATNLLATARRINESMPYYVVRLVEEGLHEVGRILAGSKIMVLGLAYRDGVKEVRNAPAIPIIKRLKELRAEVFLYDPLFSRQEIEGFGAAYRNSFEGMDCLTIVTDHREFRGYDWETIGSRMNSRVIVDGRQVVEPARVRNLGFVYKGIGYH